MFFGFFLVDEGREDPNTTIIGPLSATGETPFKWRLNFRWWANDGPTLNAGLVALRFFSGSGPVLLSYLIAL